MCWGYDPWFPQTTTPPSGQHAHLTHTSGCPVIASSPLLFQLILICVNIWDKTITYNRRWVSFVAWRCVTVGAIERFMLECDKTWAAAGCLSLWHVMQAQPQSQHKPLTMAPTLSCVMTTAWLEIGGSAHYWTTMPPCGKLKHIMKQSAIDFMHGLCVYKRNTMSAELKMELKIK